MKRHTSKHHIFSLQHLETRTLFSVPADAPVTDIPVTDDPSLLAASSYIAPRATTSHSPFTSAFNAAGTFKKPISVGNPDAGSNYQFTGAGKTSALGSFTLTGNIKGPGFIANAKATGQLLLTNSKGAITMSVNGNAAGGSLPSTLNFTITKGTKSYARSTGKGTISVSASNTTHKFVFTFHPAK